MAQHKNLFALLEYIEGDDVLKSLHAKLEPSLPVAEKKRKTKKQPQPAVKKEPSLDMLRAKALVLPDDVLSRQIVLRKRKPGERGQNRGPWWSGLSKNVMNKFEKSGGQGNGYKKKNNRRRGRSKESEYFSEDNGCGTGKGEFYVIMGNQKFEIQVQDCEERNDNLVGEEKKLKAQQSYEKKVEAEEKNSMVVEEYEKVLLEKRKVLDALEKIEKRKVSLEKDLKSVKHEEEKKEEGDSLKLIKSQKRKSKKKNNKVRVHEVRGQFLSRQGLVGVVGMVFGVAAYFFWS